MNGQERAEQNFLAFQAWATSRTDADFREMVTQGRLNRGEICRECGFGRSALVQNPRIKDEKGYHTILGRMDDVINVAGHRLGTREIEEAVQTHPAIAEVAVVGVHDELKGQMPMAFAVVKNAADVDTPEKRAALEKEVMKKVDESLGAIARPARVHFINGLPKTRSGKMLRRSIQALAEGRDAGDLTTIDDPSTLEQIKSVLKG